MDTMTNAEQKTAWMAVADHIARDVRSGAFVPGMWLKQIDLEQRYGCGRPEVRRALDYLAQKRLVQHVPNRGYHVFLPDGDRTAHILELRVILETAAVGIGCKPVRHLFVGQSLQMSDVAAHSPHSLQKAFVVRPTWQDNG